MISMFKLFLSCVLSVYLAACGTSTLAPTASTPVATDSSGAIAAVPAGTTNAQAERMVFTAKSSYATALAAAVAYKNLRVCGAGVSLPCSDPTIVAQLQKADNVAAAALDAAEAAVRTPTVGTTARDRAIQTANGALAALSALVTSLR